MFTGLRNRLTLVFVGLSVIPLIILGLIINRVSSQSLETGALALQEEISKGVAIRIDNFFSERQSELRYLIDYNGLATLRSADQKRLLDNLLSYQTAYQQLSLLDSKGQEFIRVSRFDISATADLADYSQDEVFLEPINSGKIYFSPVRFDETILEPLIGIAIPITDLRSGSISQILVAQLRFQSVWDLIASLNFTEHEDIYILDAQNKLVAHRNPSIVLRETSFAVPAQNQRTNGLSGGDVILAQSPIELGDQEFKVIAERGYAQATTLAAQLSTISFIAILVMLGTASGLALVLINQIVKPIKALGIIANAIQGGDLSRRADAHERDEIGGLALAFNSMADQLQEFIGGLENHVVERTRDLLATIEVGKLATSFSSQHTLLPKLVEFIRAQFNLYYTQIYVLDEAGKYAILRAGTGEVGQQLLARHHRLDLEETSLVARAVQTSQLVLVTDTATSAIHKPNELLPQTRSEITIPLIVGNTTIGILDMQSDQAGAFNEENRSVFEAMASQIASALRGTMAYEEAQAALYRMEATNQRLTAETWESYLGVLSQGQPLGYQYDLEAPQPLSTPLPGPDEAKPQIVYPVRLRGQQIGSIVVREDDEREWKPEERHLIEDVAQRVAQALDQYRAFDQIKQAEIEIRESAAELQTVAEVSAAAAATLNVDELLQIVSDLTKERFGLYHAHVYLLDDAGEKLVLAAGAGEIGRTMKVSGRSIPLKHPHSLVARAAREHQGIIANDVSAEPDFLPHPLLPETRSEMAVPMIAAGQLIGVLDVQAKTVDYFTVKELQVQSTLAAQIAVAVQNGRAFARANQQATIIETARDFIALVDPTGTAIYVNPTGAQLLGYDHPKELIGKKIEDVQTGDDLKLVTEVGIPTAMSTGVWRGECGITQKDGNRIPVEQTIFVIRNQQGEVTNLATIISDITERKRQQAALEEQRRLLNAVLTNIPSGIFVVEAPSAKPILSNRRAEELLGRGISPDADEAHLADVYAAYRYGTDDLYPAAEQPIVRGLYGETSYIDNMEVRRPDGTRTLLEVAGAPIKDENGNIVASVVSFQDITERKQAEAEREHLLAEAQRNAELIRTVIDATPDWIFAKDHNYRYLLVNEGYAQSIGKRPEEIVGKDDLELGYPEELVFGNPEKGIRGFRPDDIQVVTTNQEVHNPYDLVTYADGSQHILDMQKYPLRDNAGKPFASLGFGRDITQRIEQEKEIQQAREEAEILYSISSLINQAQTEQQMVEAIASYQMYPDITNISLIVSQNYDYDTAAMLTVVGDVRYDGQPSLVGVSMPKAAFPVFQLLDRYQVNACGDIYTNPLFDEPNLKAVESFGVRSYVFAPLTVGDRWMGNLTIYSDKPHVFTERELRVLAGIRDQLITVFERLRLTQQTQKRAAEMETVAQVSATTTTILDVEALLEAVSTLTKERFNLYHAHVYLLNESGDNLVLTAGAGEAGRQMKTEGRSIALNNPKSLVARAAREGQGVIANNVTQEPDFLANPLLPDTQSEMAIPLKVAGHVIGVLDVQANVIDRFTDEDVQVQSTLADQIAVAVQNARTFASVRELNSTLQENEQRFRSLVNNVPGIIYRCAIDEFWTMQFIGPAVQELTGYEYTDFIYNRVRSYASVIHPEDTAYVDAVIQENINKRTPYEIEYRVVRADGEIRWVNERGQAVYDEDGTPLWLDGAVFDNTERKNQEQQIQLYADVVKNAPVGIHVWQLENLNDNQTLRMMAANPASASATGVKAEQIVGKLMKEAFPALYDTPVPEIYANIVRSGQEVNLGEVAYGDENVTPSYFAVNAFPLPNRSVGVSFLNITESKQQQAALEEQRRLLNAVLANIPSGVFVVEAPSAKPVLSNPRAEELLGQGISPAADEAHLAEVYAAYRYGTDDLYPAAEQPIVRALYGETSAIEDMEVRRPDGSRTLLEVAGAPIKDENGNIVASVVSFQDITTRKQQEEAIREAREEAEILYSIGSLINQAEDAQQLVEAVSTYTLYPDITNMALIVSENYDYDNAAMLTIVGEVRFDNLPPLVGMSMPRDAFPVFKLLDRYRVNACEDIYTNPLFDEPNLKAVEAFGVRSYVFAPLTVGNRWMGNLTIYSDKPHTFTEREIRVLSGIRSQMIIALERLALLQETQKRAAEMETVAQVSAATTTILNPDELLQSVCDLTKASFNLYHAHIYLLDENNENLVLAAGAGEAGRAMKAEGRSISLIHPNSLVARTARHRQGIIVNDVTQEPDFLPNPLLPDTKSEMAVPMIVGDQLIGVLDVQSDMLNRFTGADLGIQNTLADQVAIAVQNARAFKVQQAAAERLREVDRLKSQFLANMSHELRTPLNSIIGYAEVLLDGIDGDLTDEAIEDVEAIHGGGKHLLSIINDILDLAKIDAGQMFMDRQEANIAKVIEEVIRTCNILIKDKGIALNFNCPDQVPNVYGDPVRLRQIVYNLVNNAIKFTEQGGVTISLEQTEEHQLCVKVQDTGIGMTPKDLNVIFERFRQVDGSATRRAGGTGLGLAITRQLVQMHEGEIHVESEPKLGSTFWFTLPVYTGQKA